MSELNKNLQRARVSFIAVYPSTGWKARETKSILKKGVDDERRKRVVK